MPPSTAKPAEHADSAPLSHAEVVDDRDVSPRAPARKLVGPRVRAIPAMGATKIRLSSADFAGMGISDHPNVEWDFAKDNFTVGVGDGEQLSKVAADAITSKFPLSFEYLGG